MELTSTNKNSFNPTPRLKSSPVPILFISFSGKDYKCSYCESYYWSIISDQKYCKNCLFEYIEKTPDYDTYLDVCGDPKKAKKDFEFLHFVQIVQIVSDYNYYYRSYYKCCNLCNKKLPKPKDFYGGSLCSDCYLISSGWIESTSANKPIPILYLPWWDAHDKCIVCSQSLEFKSDCQKWCSSCFIIYTGCRYCLTTNIIFGITNQSQCRKCERISIISIDTKNIIEQNFLISVKINSNNHKKIVNYMNIIDKNTIPLEIYNFVYELGYFPSKLIRDLSQITNLENIENVSNLIMPIIFIPFRNNEDKCYYCEEVYSETRLFGQKYCRNCLFRYIKLTASNKKCNIDVRITISTITASCRKHKPRDFYFRTQNIQEWCIECSEILFFKQIVTTFSFDVNHQKQNKTIESERYCKLCEKLIYQQNTSNDAEFRLCPDCYQVSSGLIESTLIKESIPILYLPWWDTHDKCIVCNRSLEFISSCQKWCSNCFTIYIGCRYCLTTNIIFGITGESQCKKCERISFIAIDTENIIEQSILLVAKVNTNNHKQIANYMNTVDKIYNPLNVYSFMEKLNYIIEKEFLANIDAMGVDGRQKVSDCMNNSIDDIKDIYSFIIKTKLIGSYYSVEWIPHSQITDFEKIAEGGFGVIYKALYNNSTIAIKKLLYSQNISKNFLNELKSLYKCYDDKFEYIIKCHGVTIDPITQELMFIMKYANGGNLHDYLQRNFNDITWKRKLYILWRISDGLKTIHEKNFIHRDFHSGNILVEIIANIDQYLIGDLGLSQPANSTLLNNNIYGVIPYVAPEVLNSNGAIFTKESDIYSMGMIMWELTSGCKPFANIEHDIELINKIVVNGERPEITIDTPEDFSNLMRKCWSSNPKKRPSAKKICEAFNSWSNMEEDVNQFKQAEEIRLELIKSKMLGPEFSDKPHSKAVFTSRPLNSFIFTSSTANPSSRTSLNINKDNQPDDGEYITKEYDLDISSNSTANTS